MMNKKMSLLLSPVFLTSILIGCQSQEDTQKENDPSKVAKQTEASPSSEDGAENMKIEDSIATISISKDGEVIRFNDDASIETLRAVIESAMKEDGIVNMSNPTHYVDVVYANEDKQRFHFWYGEAGERSAMMSADDTHSIYTVSAALTEKIIILTQ
ncbi:MULTISPECIES: hypothetical protein [Exiguobacterium]|uniref:hypothetical protein n=1 Tax=Exiguobacterium TaxID=33986 RepID=UPI000462D873|nr:MULTISPECIES: hypothetical protein [Exiguobacterium]MCT4782277.1 hypothetical protein [Exiguobacterium himgiriensis]